MSLGVNAKDLVKFTWKVKLEYTTLDGSQRLRKDEFLVFADNPTSAINNCKIETEERLDMIIVVSGAHAVKYHPAMLLRNHVLHLKKDYQ